MMNEVPTPSIERFQQLYKQADHYTSSVSILALEAVIPAHNQLRYAGHHFHKAIGEEGGVENDGELRKAIGHCERALYEASETGIIVALEQLARFEEDYRGINISSVVEEIKNVRKLRRRAHDLLSRTRAESDEAPKETAEYMKVFEELREGMFILEDNRHDLDAERDKEKALRRHQLGQWAQGQIAEKNRTIRWLIGLLVVSTIAILKLWFG